MCGVMRLGMSLVILKHSYMRKINNRFAMVGMADKNMYLLIDHRTFSIVLYKYFKVVQPNRPHDSEPVLYKRGFLYYVNHI